MGALEKFRSAGEFCHLAKLSQISPSITLNDTLGEAELAESLMCINGMRLLEYAAENGGIELTKSGFFNRKCVVWAAEEFQWPDYRPSELYRVNKVLNEQDVLPLSVMHDLMLLARLMRHVKGRAVLTSAGKNMQRKHGSLQALLFETNFTRYDFGADERFPNYIEHQDYRHILGVIANRVGEWTTLGDFAHWCFPIPLMAGRSGRPEFEACLLLRFNIVRPLKWLGLMEEADALDLTPIEQRRIRKAALFDQFMHFGVQISPKVYH